MRIIFVNGTFDIIHTGHIELLNYAKSLGDKLVVAIDSDERVKELKGGERPINKVLDRKFHLMNLRCVDYCTYFKSDDELCRILRLWSPDIMVKGSEYKTKPIIGVEYCKEIMFFDTVEGYSTTNIIERIKK